MKKTKLLLTSLVLSAAVLSGCGETAEAGHFGFGGVATYSIKAPTASAVGSVTTEINYASLVLGKDGKIKQLRIDTVQVKVAPNAEATATINTGKTVDNAGIDTRSKWELLEEYNMNGAAGEWYEQAENFEEFAVGKTVAELVALEAEDHYFGAETKTAAGVSIHVNGFMAAIERAEANKVAVADVKDLKIGVGGVGTHAALQSNYTIAGAAFDKDHKVVAARMDVYQVPYTITAATEALFAAATINTTKGQVDAANSAIKSKHDLGEAYNMNAPKGEWYEQANKITAYMIGKTVAVALEINAETSHMVNEVAADVTIKAVDYYNAFVEADDTAFNSRIPA